jgi:hypothetical protein
VAGPVRRLSQQNMPTLLILPTALIIIAGVTNLALSRKRPWLASFAAAVTCGVALLWWLPVQTQLPLDLVPAATHALGDLSATTLQVSGHVHQITFYMLLALFAALCAGVGKRLSGSSGADSRPASFAAATLLLAAGLLAIWAASPAALLRFWTLLFIAWSLLMWTSRSAKDEAGRLLARAGAMATSLLFLALAATAVPIQFGSAAEPGVWPASAKLWAALAAAVQLGGLHFRGQAAGGEPSGGRQRAEWAAVGVRVAPAAAAVSLLVRLQLSGGGSMAAVVMLTVVGLLWMMAGAQMAWSHIADQRRVAGALSLALSGLILLMAAWTGPDAIVAGSGVLLLATTVYTLLDVRQMVPAPRWQRVGVLVAVAAVLGLPFTGGYIALAALYAGLRAGGGALLMPVIVVFLVALGGALVLTIWRRSRWPGKEKAPGPGPGPGRAPGLAAYVLVSGQVLPLLGLLALRVPLPDLLPALAIAVGLAGSVLLARFAGRLTTARAIARQAGQVTVRTTGITGAWREATRSTAAAVREAEAILESEGGLVWLMVLVLLAFLAVGLS